MLVGVVDCNPEIPIPSQIFQFKGQVEIILIHPEIQDIGTDSQVAHLLVTEKCPELHRGQMILVGENGIDNGKRATQSQQDSQMNLIKISVKE